MQYHKVPFPLRQALAKFDAPVLPQSEVRWARETPTTCLVFVHGFGGQAVATWGEFPDMAIDDIRFARTDLFFIGYDSRTSTASYNVSVLYRLVRVLAESPLDVLKEVRGPTRPEDFEYKKIVLVGHSLGGALVRDVAMNAKVQDFPWANKLDLALFAPAHLGANLIDLVVTGFGFLNWISALRSAAIYSFPSLRDLEKNSTFLVRLLNIAQQIGIHCTTKASFVVHAKDDKIVFQDIFFKDEPALPYENSDHSSCCKPARVKFQSPFNDVAKVLL